MRRWGTAVSVMLVCATSGGCVVQSVLPSSGPNRDAVVSESRSEIEVVQVADLARVRRQLFSETLGSGEDTRYTIDRGDVLEISVWEAPPALLFSGADLEVRQTNPFAAFSVSGADGQQRRNDQGSICRADPGRGPQAAGDRSGGRRKTQRQSEQPQALVRLAHNASLNVPVVGEVAASQRVPLTPRGGRLLDALAAAGGVRQPVNKMSVQGARSGRVAVLPLETIIHDPNQNIVLRGGDVITALHQPLTLTVLGAVAKNEELSFEAHGISLTQPLGRIGFAV